MTSEFDILLRDSIHLDYAVPPGWHRVAVCDEEDEEEHDSWFSFLQELVFSHADNFDKYDGGLLTFIARGEGEEWRLVEVQEEEMEVWRPGPGWEVVDITLDNMSHYLPRMGYLFTDGLFDLGKVATGVQKFLLKENSDSSPTVRDEAKRKYKEYKFCLRVTEEEWLEEPGFTDVTLSQSMVEDLQVNVEFRDDVVNGRKKIVGKL